MEAIMRTMLRTQWHEKECSASLSHAPTRVATSEGQTILIAFLPRLVAGKNGSKQKML